MEAKVIEDSISEAGVRLATLQLRYPRFIHAEFMTHRVFSRNASSSRAIPVAKMLTQVRDDPAMPLHWGKNQPGMQANEQLQGDQLESAKEHWHQAALAAAEIAESMARIGLHKQVANRILEPFQYISVIVTATEWDNFFELRDHEDAQPEIRALARVMKDAMDDSRPVLRRNHAPGALLVDSWHLPYVTSDERNKYHDDPFFLCKLSTARCARVSYLTHDGAVPNIDKDVELHDRLVAARPIHASPTEHQARPASAEEALLMHKNFKGWLQYRYRVEYLAKRA